MNCRPGCGACCIAPSISSPIPGMSGGKPAGVRCVQLLPDFRCALFGRPERPAVCVSLRPTEEMCGANRDEAMRFLAALDTATRPPATRPAPAASAGLALAEAASAAEERAGLRVADFDGTRSTLHGQTGRSIA